MSEKSFEMRILDGHGDGSLLCQPDGERGCGGCCTNFSQPRHILESIFSVRKEVYDAWVQSEDDMLLYRKKMDLMERGTSYPSWMIGIALLDACFILAGRRIAAGISGTTASTKTVASAIPTSAHLLRIF
jgi:hypothetical protein